MNLKKKLISTLVVSTMLLTTPMTAFAGTLTMNLGSRIATMDGKQIVLDNAAGTVKDEIMVPVRAVAEAYGGTVVYNSETNTVSMEFPNGHWATIEISRLVGTEGEFEDAFIDIGVFIKGHLYIPADLMAICLGASVEAIDYGADHVYRLIYHVR